MTRLSSERLYDYLIVAERQMDEGHLWLARQVLWALEDIAAEAGEGLPQKYYSLRDEYHSRAADRLLEDFLSKA